VDDGSDDGTAEIARSLAAIHAQLKVVAAPNLPTGWTGKAHAMWTGYEVSSPEVEWLLFVDADTRHMPEMLASVVMRAEETGADLLSLVTGPDMRTFWERVLVPQAGELYTLLVGPMDDVNRRGGQAAANGQFILLRRNIYGRIGNLPEVRGDVAEDRALALACKTRGYGLRLEYGRQLVKSRDYSSLREIWAGYSKTLFWASGQNLPKSLAVALALAMYALLPPLALAVALVRGDRTERKQAAFHAALQLAPMLALRAAACRRLGIPPTYAFTYPLGVAVGDAMLLYSVYRVVSGKGVWWKGRVYR
jgi:chlorobactene glucosyltransferase